MVVSALPRGLLGLDSSATSHQLRFAPHGTAEWKSFEVGNIQVADAMIDLKYERTEDGITVQIGRTGSGDLAMEFSPALSPRAEVTRTKLNGRPVSRLSNATARINALRCASRFRAGRARSISACATTLATTRPRTSRRSENAARACEFFPNLGVRTANT